MAGGDALLLRGARWVSQGASQLLRAGPQSIVIAADFTEQGDMAFRLAGEIRHCSRSAKTVSVVQTRRPSASDGVAAEIRTCIRRDLARRTGPDDIMRCDTLILHRPAIAGDLADLFDRVEFAELKLVCHTPDDIEVARDLDTRRRKTSIFVTNALLSGHRSQDIIETGFWSPVVDPVLPTATLSKTGRATAVCWVGTLPPDLRQQGIFRPPCDPRLSNTTRLKARPRFIPRASTRFRWTVWYREWTSLSLPLTDLRATCPTPLLQGHCAQGSRSSCRPP